MKAPRQPGVEPRKEARVYCRHRPPCMMSVIRLLLAVSIKSTKSIITKTKTVIIRACLKISRISISFSPYRLADCLTILYYHILGTSSSSSIQWLDTRLSGAPLPTYDCKLFHVNNSYLNNEIRVFSGRKHKDNHENTKEGKHEMLFCFFVPSYFRDNFFGSGLFGLVRKLLQHH